MNRKKGGRFSSKPRKQRLRIYSAGLHALGRRMSAHLSRELRKELGKRSIEVREGDRVKIMRGGKKKSSGKITAVDRKKGVVFIEGVMRKKADGKEVPLPLNASNLLVTEIERKDERRLSKGKGQKGREAEKKPEGTGQKKKEGAGKEKKGKKENAGKKK